MSDALDRLYAQLPTLQCQGLCEDSCGPIAMSRAEAQRLESAGVDVTTIGGDLTCPALTKTFGVGRCSVYEIRPMICRLWGMVESMPCPYGCVPEGGHLDDVEGRRLLQESIRLGGGMDDGGFQATMGTVSKAVNRRPSRP